MAFVVDFLVFGMSDEACSDFWSEYFHALHTGKKVRKIVL